MSGFRNRLMTPLKLVSNYTNSSDENYSSEPNLFFLRQDTTVAGTYYTLCDISGRSGQLEKLTTNSGQNNGDRLRITIDGGTPILFSTYSSSVLGSPMYGYTKSFTNTGATLLGTQVFMLLQKLKFKNSIKIERMVNNTFGIEAGCEISYFKKSIPKGFNSLTSNLYQNCVNNTQYTLLNISGKGELYRTGLLNLSDYSLNNILELEINIDGTVSTLKTTTVNGQGLLAGVYGSTTTNTRSDSGIEIIGKYKFNNSCVIKVKQTSGVDKYLFAVAEYTQEQ